MNILLVEDNPLDADLIGRAVAAMPGSSRPVVVGTLADARARLADGSGFELVLTDLNLPDGSGLELIVELRTRALPLAVVALTSQGDEQVVLTALKAGADDYLAKSDDYELRLPATLNAALARFRADRSRQARPLRVLYAECNANDVELTRLQFELSAPHIRLDVVGSAAEVQARLAQRAGEPLDFDVLLLDYRLPGDTGLDVLKQVREDRGLDLPVVMVTGQGSEDVAAQAMRLGASDYRVKREGYLFELPLALESAFHRVEADRERAALGRSQERLNLVLRGSNDGPWDIDLERGESYLSPRCWQMLDRPVEAVACDAALLQRLVHPLEFAGLRERLLGLLSGTAESFEIELRLQCRDGHFLPVLARGFVLRDAKGRARRISGTNTDLSERKRAEAAIRELNASLERRVSERTRELEIANRELEAFAFSVSHDLRAPLRAIDGLGAMLELEAGPALSGESARKLAMLRDSARRMNALIEDLLRFSRSSREPMRRVEAPTAALVQHCIDEVRDEVDARRIELVVGELPSCSADASLLRQVFANLIGNAVKYSRKQARPRIEIGSKPDGARRVFFVRDNGAGFDMQYAGKLFGVFQRMHRADEFEGTGVGLAIVARIVERHGGRVWAEAVPQQGATFYFSIGDPRDAELAA